MPRHPAHRPTLDDVPWPVETARLTLRRATQDDAGAVFAYRSDAEVARWLSKHQVDRARWEEEWRERVPRAIIPERDGQLLGDTRIVVRDAWSQSEVAASAERMEAELMWTFAPPSRGHGYATETVAALIELAFGVLCVRRVVAVCYADNTASWRLMERVGMHREGHSVRSTLHRDGTWRDFLTYARLAPDA